ncbi:hypothetical protein E4T39_06313 [Aureobasidium subglaciale]|nr:hypothetical protein E4T39_06313 [Aureobasidium subglaciale]
MPALRLTTLHGRDLMEKMTSHENIAWAIIAITGSWCFLAVIIVVTRVYTRLVMVKYLGWDDIFAVITMVLGIFIWGCFIGESNWALGKHYQDITPEMLVMYSKWQFAHGMITVWALYGMQVAFALFLLRLSNGKVFRRTLFAVMCFTTIYTTVSWFTILFGCAPISANWRSRDGKCISPTAFRSLGMTYSILGMLTNVFLALIPVPIISGMQLNIRTKICLLLAFSMGLAAVACGAVKSYHLWYYFGDRDRLYHNTYFVWGALELYVGIIAACMVSLKPLIASFLEKAKSTLVSSAALAKHLHHGTSGPHSPHYSPRFDEKTEQQFNTFNTQNFPHIEICSVSNYEKPDLSLIVEQPKVFTVELDTNSSQTSLSSNSVITSAQRPKRKKRPAPLKTAAFIRRRSSLELSCMGGILSSPSPTYLPSAIDFGFLDLVKGRDPETLSQIQRKEGRLSDAGISFPAPGIDSPGTMTRSNTPRGSLSVPNICGLLTSPSPTFLPSPSSNDLDFFSLIRCRDPETIAASKVSSSRRTTIISIPEDQNISFPVGRRATLAHTRYQSIDFSEGITATTQIMQRVNTGEVRRRPSMAPSTNSATSAFLCPPIHQEELRESQMFFHVMSSGQFRSTAETAAKQLEVEEMPLSPMSVEPVRDSRFNDQPAFVGFNPVFDGRFVDEFSHGASKKDE